MPQITEQLLLAARTVNGGWKKAQLTLLGIAWPPPKGWKATAIGQEISVEAAQKLVLLKDTDLSA